MSSPKYPRTPHLPWSPGGTSDDKRIESVAQFLVEPVVFTEKMDGSNVCLEAAGCFARSHSAAPSHPSFDAFKAYHASVRHLIPEGLQIFGEWLFAQHSIAYSELPGYFQVFGVRDLGTLQWCSWEDTGLWAEELGAPLVPLLSQTSVRTEGELQALTDSLAAAPSLCGGEREGVVVRVARAFSDSMFATSVAKWVRKGHVQTDTHWKHQEITRNGVVG